MSLSFVATATPPQKNVAYPAYQPRTGLLPHGQFVTDTLCAKQLPLSTVAERMGYTKLKKGINAIATFVYDAKISPEFVAKLAAGLDVPLVDLEAAVQRTRNAMADEEERYKVWQEERNRSLFVPYLVVQHERRHPTPLFPLDYSQFRFVALPENISQLPLQEQFKVIKEVIRNRPKASPFGAVRGYVYRQTFDASIALDVTGIPIQPVDENSENQRD